MSNFLNQDFGSDEEDDDFNPVAGDESEGEDSKVSCVIRQVPVGHGTDTRAMNSQPSPYAVVPMVPMTM